MVGFLSHVFDEVVVWPKKQHLPIGSTSVGCACRWLVAVLVVVVRRRCRGCGCVVVAVVVVVGVVVVVSCRRLSLAFSSRS